MPKTRSENGMNRSMGWKMTINGRAVTCSSCAWWAPVLQDVDAAKVEFDAHVCTEHPPLRMMKKPSALQHLL